MGRILVIALTYNIPIYAEMSENDIIDLNKQISNEFIEVCGVKIGDRYTIMGAGVGMCSFYLPEKYYGKLTIFHTHPNNVEPSDIDISSIERIGGKMYILTPNKKYILNFNKSTDTLLIEEQKLLYD